MNILIVDTFDQTFDSLTYQDYKNNKYDGKGCNYGLNMSAVLKKYLKKYLIFAVCILVSYLSGNIIGLQNKGY